MQRAESETPMEETEITPEEPASAESPEGVQAEATHIDAAAALFYEKQIADLKDQLLRTLAESDNLRKRAQREVEEAGKYAVSKFARELVTVSENFFRAADALPQDVKESSDAVRNYALGIEMTAGEMSRVLERFGIHRVMPQPGEAFNHQQHQAVTQIPSADHPVGSIVMVMQAGYMLHDRLLIPAMVGVAAAMPAAGAPEAHVDTKA